MSLQIFLAKRFLLPRKDTSQDLKFISFITLISILGVAIGVTALIIAVCILNGFEREITEKAVSLSSHIQVISFKPEGIKDYQSIIAIITNSNEIPWVVSAHPYVQREAVIKYKDNTEGIILKGVRNEDGIFNSQRKIINGTGDLQVKDSTSPPVIVGSKLSSKLNISIGSSIFIIAATGIPSAVNTPDVKKFNVVGIYESTLREYDDVLLYTDLKDAQKMFNTGSNVSGIEVMVKDIDKIKETTDRIKKVLGYPFYARSVFQLFKGLFTWVELQKKPIPIVLGLITIVAAFNIIGFLLMIVLEKTETIGILKSLGSTDLDVIKVFFYQGMFIAIIGIIIGNVAGYGVCLLQLNYNIIKLPEIYYMDHVPILINWSAGVLITVVALVLSFLVTIIPSYLASRLSPVTSLRFK
jgi:lipoprotein-releasing system permease protein